MKRNNHTKRMLIVVAIGVLIAVHHQINVVHNIFLKLMYLKVVNIFIIFTIYESQLNSVRK